MSEAQALAQIVKRLDDVRTDITALRADIVGVHKHSAAIEALDRRLTLVESDAQKRHLPWPTIVTAVIAAITLGVLIYT